MLTELPQVSQQDGESRRWFGDEAMELIVWQGADGEIAAFELSYDLNAAWRVVKWTPERGCRHLDVLSGDGVSQISEPITVLIGISDPIPHELAHDFALRAQNLDAETVGFVAGQLARGMGATSQA